MLPYMHLFITFPLKHKKQNAGKRVLLFMLLRSGSQRKKTSGFAPGRAFFPGASFRRRVCRDKKSRRKIQQLTFPIRGW